MASKQEKLAAARRKLREFQGKNRETNISRHKDINEILGPQLSKDSSQPSSESSRSCTPITNENRNLENIQRDLKYFYPSGPNDQTNITEDYNNQRKASDLFSNKSNSPVLSLGGSQSPHNGSDRNLSNDRPGSEMSFSEIGKPDFESKIILSNNPVMSHNGSLTDAALGTNNAECQTGDRNNHQNISNAFAGNSGQTVSPPSMLSKSNVMNDSFALTQNNYSYLNEPYEFFNNKINTNNALEEVIRPLQIELQNHAQTINILIQQRSDAQSALTRAQSSLLQKTGEVSELQGQVDFLTSLVETMKYTHNEKTEKIEKLEREKNQTLQKNNDLMTSLDVLQGKVDFKEEECSELKRKYEEKNKECQQLLHNLNDAQSQLSLCQIKIQELSSGEHSAFSIQVSQLQNENLNLRQRIQELEKQIEVDSTEKVEASQKFHSYVQQCNSQLNALNSQVQNLTAENEKLRKENSILLKDLSELENDQEEDPLPPDYKIEIGDLHSQISVLSEANQQLRNDLTLKGEELVGYQKQLEEKDLEIKDLSTLVQEVEAENKKLLTEIETPRGNERLLAAMESDKVAAAKAVSQNQKLKEQIAEFEKAFMKLSEEKLQLTDELAHEKHVNKELQGMLKSLESHHHDHDDDHECHHHEMEPKPEPLVNDSNEIEELRNIIRQLQDDKIELKDRLNSFMLSTVNIQNEKNEEEKCGHGHEHKHDHGHEHNHGHEHEHRHDHGHEHNHGPDHDHGHEHDHGQEHEDEHEHEGDDTAKENTKLVLQQMEEKLKRTMNEIAKLDEEKEKLEHLVLQLQGETETIGEYITLYQKQRMMLRQRAQEKDIQLIQLSKDKEELRSKLENLDELVQHLLAERENNGLQSESQRSAVEPTKEASENTAVKIRALISEIGSTTLVNSNSVAFEHCSCCSGRLITI